MQPATKSRFPGCQFQLTLHVNAGVVLNSLETEAIQDKDLGRHLAWKIAGVPGCGGGKQQGGIQWLLLLLTFLWLERMVAMTTEEVSCFPTFKLLLS